MGRHIPAGLEASVSEVRARNVTALLMRWRAGDEAAVQELVPLVHAELRRLAKHYMAGERRVTRCRPRRW